MKYKLLLWTLFVTIFWSGSYAQQELLQSGPMLGYADLREVMIWVQTKESAHVRVEYWSKEQTGATKNIMQQDAVYDNGFSVKFTCSNLEPGTEYLYELFINDKKLSFDSPLSFKTQALWQFRSDPPDFNFATGSCAFINEEKYDRSGKPYGGDYRIFESIAAKQPDFMLWLGDNVYYREVDWNTRSGMIYRNTHTRSIPEMQKLLRTSNHYAIWDDHDYGPNNSDRSFWNKKNALEVFEMFWCNPSYGIGDVKGAFTFFQWNDVDFFLLDNRYYRTPDYLKADDKTVLGKEQLDWLIESLIFNYSSTFKVVVMGGQFLNDAGQYEIYSSFGFEKERQYIIDQIYKHNIKGVIFITGDRHHSELSVLKKEGAPTIYDLTISPLTSSVSTVENERNSLRVDNTFIKKRAFALIEVKGSKKNNERKFYIRTMDSDGKEIWNYTISRDEF